MEHLSTETLARLVDERPTPEEAAHLSECAPCQHELEALRQQTDALGTLPELMPPKGHWDVVEARLRSEGLIETPGLFQKLGLAQTPQWMKAAAAVTIFFTGAATGAALSGERGTTLLGSTVAQAESVEEAASAMRVAEDEYVAAFARYRELLAEEGGEAMVGDPLDRYAALEHLVSVSQAAVRQAPADPFLNGVLASALAERDAVARMVAANGGRWF